MNSVPLFDHVRKIFSSILILGLMIVPVHHTFADDSLDLETLDQMIEEIQLDTFKEGDVSPPVPGGEVSEGFFSKLKEWAIKLAEKAGMSFSELKGEATSIVENLQTLDENNTVSYNIDPENKNGSIHYYMDVPEPLAEELGIDEKYELYEVQFSWFKKDDGVNQP
ncbi:hypothetical protein BVX98_03365 [bacterium F11]|nr:hypothetical protein BVX98_03365 [bacterium F11]